MVKTYSTVDFQNPEKSAKRLKAYQDYIDMLQKEKGQNPDKDSEHKSDCEAEN